MEARASVWDALLGLLGWGVAPECCCSCRALLEYPTRSGRCRRCFERWVAQNLPQGSGVQYPIRKPAAPSIEMGYV